MGSGFTNKGPVSRCHRNLLLSRLPRVWLSGIWWKTSPWPGLGLSTKILSQPGVPHAKGVFHRSGEAFRDVVHLRPRPVSWLGDLALPACLPFQICRGHQSTPYPNEATEEAFVFGAGDGTEGMRHLCARDMMQSWAQESLSSPHVGTFKEGWGRIISDRQCSLPSFLPKAQGNIQSSPFYCHNDPVR